MIIELNTYKTNDKYVNLNDLIKFYFQDVKQNFMCCFNGHTHLLINCDEANEGWLCGPTSRVWETLLIG